MPRSRRTDGLAARLIRDRQAIGECRRQADQAAERFRDPASPKPMSIPPPPKPLGLASPASAASPAPSLPSPATRQPSAPSRAAAASSASSPTASAPTPSPRHAGVPEAGSLAWDRAIARDLDRAATFKLDTLEAGAGADTAAARPSPNAAPNIGRPICAARPPHSARNADLAELGTAIRQARHIGPDARNPAALAIQWAANLAGPELAAITKLAGLYKAACRTMLTAEFKSRDPSAAAAWERANQRSVERDRGPSLGR
ncbi:MAG: hypothetical protein WDN69_22825 [Aliidongia sp.]